MDSDCESGDLQEPWGQWTCPICKGISESAYSRCDDCANKIMRSDVEASGSCVGSRSAVKVLDDLPWCDFPWCDACESYHHPANVTCLRRNEIWKAGYVACETAAIKGIDCLVKACERLEEQEDYYINRMAVVAIVCFVLGLAVGWFMP
jgi:hypothetical protein